MATFDIIAPIVARLFDRPVTELTRDTHLADDLRGDSLDFWELVIACEEEFPGVEISEADTEDDKIATLGDLAALIDRKLAASARSAA